MVTPRAERVILDLEPSKHAYRNLTSLVIPRPIAWVSSRSVEGIDNLAPHSFFTVVSDTPPIIAFTSMGEKDTLRNIVATGEFVVCGTPVPLREQVNITGTTYPHSMSEFDEAGLERGNRSLWSPLHASPQRRMRWSAGSSAPMHRAAGRSSWVKSCAWR